MKKKTSTYKVRVYEKNSCEIIDLLKKQRDGLKCLLEAYQNIFLTAAEIIDEYEFEFNCMFEKHLKKVKNQAQEELWKENEPTKYKSKQ